MLRGWISTRSLFLAGIIILLAGLVIGGLYFVRERGEAVRRDVIVQEAEEQLREDSNPEIAATADEEEENTPTEAEETPSSVEELPETGPAETLTGLFAVVFLTYTISSYVVSRKPFSTPV